MHSYHTYPDDYSPKFVAIGIDFGTTYSGVSWARSTNPKEVNSITGWASDDHRNQNEVQVPTLYDIDSGKWGFEITPDMKPMKWFKLLLLKNEDIAKEEIRNAPQLQQARDILSNSRKRLTAVQVVGYYLKNVWDHTYAALKSMLDVDNLPLRVAITIPAIWPAYAQSAMREAAKIAGIMKYRDIGETTLILVQEPEAAALASLFQRNSSPEIQQNESFVVCDAGGGTVDVISYKVVSERPFKLEECVPGTGKLAGAFQIDQAFESYVRGKAKLKISSLKDFDYNQFILREWELGAKRSFSISNAQENYHLHPPSKAYGTLARLRHKDTLIISNEEMTGFFNRSLTGIRTLVGNQCKEVQEETGKPPKKILLVGGLGSSEYVYDKLTEIFSNKVLRPSDGWSAVARGAVLRLLQENISAQPVHSPEDREALGSLPDVISYRSRYHYGIVVSTSIKGLDLDPEDVVTLNPEGFKRVERMRWYLLKGDKIDKKSRIPFFYHHYYRPTDVPEKCAFKIVYSAEDPAPKRSNSAVMSFCRIECDWDKPITEWQRVGDPSEGWRKHDDLELTMGLQGEPKWEVRVGSNKREHKFDIEYAS
ncbi:heat shock 70 kDa 12B [Fusarium tjaetaba]|uniref:Heat shock 70 kDa 12B n=1 Tax=Fusarium tjaetaba TaxID=1567544 RepID=A0A8H5VP75_9HYPO|nr:heat shock 70 kDa 12B [Fusarium tjaetaba]KAF5632237.1 heat shock 70 kDa 12B [Fusarium tjaetaba]